MTGLYQRRRAFVLWLPLLTLGVLLSLTSAATAPLFNGLTLLGTLLAFTGLTALAVDNRESLR